MKKNIPLAIVFILGIGFIIQFFIPSKPSQTIFNTMVGWDLILYVFASIIAVDSLVRHHVIKISRKTKGWGYSTVYLGATLFMVLAAVFSGALLTVSWAAVQPSGNLQATLSWVPNGRGESLFAAAGERSAPEAITALLIQARRELYHHYPQLVLEFPVGPFDEAILAAGFKPQRTLIWMQATS